MTAAALGGASTLTWSLLAYYTANLIIGALVVNIWEEMAWTGYLQRRAMARWGVTAGSLFAAVFFIGIHLPLALGRAHSAEQAATNILLVAGVAIGLRVLIGHLDKWSGRSLLTIGVLHSSFNATENLLDPAHDWVRIVLTIAAAVGIVAAAQPEPRQARPQDRHSSREAAVRRPLTGGMPSACPASIPARDRAR